ncbi:hypothetical protein HA052_02560 [Chromobacterium haemolyticum]|uniref:Uncharacterized protein n=1 Tax=Chromobacterium fluminis TaxID=3044269 RepID=A0ABX0KZT2_9NEIS|nr:hypothetical protein [Chromobacterium haemolyticum]NHR04070.1 hypothetical protein [Chromobacterium haemolyticum]OQS44815.1 hypothetical protein B0T39_00785 [Chromobacterium haemolyticum]
MKKTILTALSLIILSGAAMAGGEGANNAREMRERMDAQIAAKQAASQQTATAGAQAKQSAS